jgi:hypothetical protein
VYTARRGAHSFHFCQMREEDPAVPIRHCGTEIYEAAPTHILAIICVCLSQRRKEIIQINNSFCVESDNHTSCSGFS